MTTVASLAEARGVRRESALVSHSATASAACAPRDQTRQRRSRRSSRPASRRTARPAATCAARDDSRKGAKAGRIPPFPGGGAGSRAHLRDVDVTRAHDLGIGARDLVTRAQDLVTRAQDLVIRAQDLVIRAQDLVTRARDLVTRARDLVTRARDFVMRGYERTRFPASSPSTPADPAGSSAVSPALDFAVIAPPTSEVHPKPMTEPREGRPCGGPNMVEAQGIAFGCTKALRSAPEADDRAQGGLPLRQPEHGGGAGNRTLVRKLLTHASTYVSGKLTHARARLPAGSPWS